MKEQEPITKLANLQKELSELHLQIERFNAAIRVLDEGLRRHAERERQERERPEPPAPLRES